MVHKLKTRNLQDVHKYVQYKIWKREWKKISDKNRKIPLKSALPSNAWCYLAVKIIPIYQFLISPNGCQTVGKQMKLDLVIVQISTVKVNFQIFTKCAPGVRITAKKNVR